jgi:phosphoethanolamine N-methyltransferase
MSQYSPRSILRYERIFGTDFVSPGGLETTRALAARLGLRPGARVLDLGSGLGGASFWLALEHGARVTGVDVSPEMVAAANARLRQRRIAGVQFIEGDISRVEFAPGAFDALWSRDSLLHVPDKPAVFRRLRGWLEPDGRVLLTDYARGAGALSESFRRYVDESGYHLLDLPSYGAVLAGAGFEEVRVEDRTAELERLLARELEGLETRRAELAAELEPAELDYLAARWRMKLEFCRGGDLKWAELGSRLPPRRA